MLPYWKKKWWLWISLSQEGFMPQCWGKTMGADIISPLESNTVPGRLGLWIRERWFISSKMEFGGQVNFIMGFPSGSAEKESASNARDTRDTGLISGLGRSPGGGKWQPTPVLFPEKSHRQRSLVRYSSKGHKESDMTEWLSYLLFCIIEHTHNFFFNIFRKRINWQNEDKQ